MNQNTITNSNDIDTMLVECQFCRKDVYFSALPFHEFLCKEAPGKVDPDPLDDEYDSTDDDVCIIHK